MPVTVLDSLPLSGDLDPTLVHLNPEDWISTPFILSLLDKEGELVSASASSASGQPKADAAGPCSSKAAEVEKSQPPVADLEVKEKGGNTGAMKTLVAEQASPAKGVLPQVESTKQLDETKCVGEPKQVKTSMEPSGSTHVEPADMDLQQESELIPPTQPDKAGPCDYTAPHVSSSFCIGANPQTWYDKTYIMLKRVTLGIYRCCTLPRSGPSCNFLQIINSQLPLTEVAKTKLEQWFNSHNRF